MNSFITEFVALHCWSVGCSVTRCVQGMQVLDASVLQKLDAVSLQDDSDPNDILGFSKVFDPSGSLVTTTPLRVLIVS